MKKYWTPGLGRHLFLHPADGVAVLRAGLRLRRKNWWRRAPFLPIPDAKYWEFRMSTVNGASGELTPKDVVVAAKWSLQQPVGN